jgi:hypothetical protein
MIESVLRVALSYEHMKEYGGDNRGPESIERFLKFVRAEPGQPWCAAYVSFCGYYGNLDVVKGTYQSTWPFKPTASCWQLGDWATTAGVLVTRPQPGAVFLLHSPKLGRFHHTGFVLTASGDTIEGNTNDDGSANGYEVLPRHRSFGLHDRFILWWKLIK